MSAIDQELITKVNQLLQVYPASVTRLCSTVIHNRLVGGAKNSLHVSGQAIDLVVDDPSCLIAMAKYAVNLGFWGIEVDFTNNHLHLDVRKTQVWHIVKTKDFSYTLDDYLVKYPLTPSLI